MKAVQASRFLISPITLLCAVGSLLRVAPTLAQTPATVPVGYLKVNLPAGTSIAPSRTSFHVALQDIPSVPAGAATGRLTALTASTFSDSTAAWTPGALSVRATPYFLRIVTGAARGTVWQISTSPANTATTLTVVNQGIDLATLGIVANADTYEIFPGDTLLTLFQTAGLLPGPDANVADTVEIWSGAWLKYYFNSTRNQWERTGAGSANFNDTVVRPDVGMILVHRGPATSFRLTGRISPSDVQIRYAKGGSTYLGGFPVRDTLGSARFQDLPGWKTNADPTQADVVQIWNGAWITYYYNPSSATPQWQRSGAPGSADSTEIFTPGHPVMFVKRGTAPGSSFLVQARPYPE